jgi:hypothetical protein
MNKKFWLGMIAYVVPSFPLAFAWHLKTFASNYAALDLLRDDPILPMGFATMLIQGALFSWAYPRLFDTNRAAWLGSAAKAFAFFGMLAWTYAVLAVAAKIHMVSVADFLVLETGWTILQFAVTMPLLAFVHRHISTAK